MVDSMIRGPVRVARGALRRAALLLGLSGLAAFASATVIAGVSGAVASSGGLRQLGTMDVAFGATGSGARLDPSTKVADNYPPPMVVDSVHHLGFTVEVEPSQSKDATGGYVDAIVVYDLKTMEYLTAVDPGSIDPSLATVLTPLAILSASIDTSKETMYLPLPYTPSSITFSCAGPTVLVVDYSQLTDGTADPAVSLTAEQLPCLGNQSWQTLGGSFDPSSGNLYFLAVNETANSPSGIVSTYQPFDDGVPIYVVEVNPDGGSPTIDWVVNLTYAGCGRVDSPFFVQRDGNRVLTYCYDPTEENVDATGQAGYVVEIPLSASGGGDKPIPQANTGLVCSPVDLVCANATIERTPALSTGPGYPGDPSAQVDPTSGNLLLVSSDPVNGQSVWVFDPVARRFDGVITGGQVDPPVGDFGVGLDTTKGNVYVLTPAGILVASSSTLGGVVYPVLANEEDAPYFALNTAQYHGTTAATTGYATALTAATIGVDTSLHRLFVPRPGQGWVVVEDDTPVPKAPPPLDPDSFTTQMQEAVGVTTSNATGEAEAAGAHVLLAGGLPRVASSKDPFCNSLAPGSFIFDPLAANSSQSTPNPYPPLLGSQPIGPPEYSPEKSLGNGVNGSGLPVLQGPQDSCLAERVLTPGDRDFSLAATKLQVGTATGAVANGAGMTFSPNDYADASDFQRYHVNACGTQGFQNPDGTCTQTGYPVAASQCGDYGEGQQDQKQPVGQQLPAMADPIVTASEVSCNASTNNAASWAEADGMALPAPGGPIVAVGQTFSKVVTQLTKSGQLTTAVADAYGVVLGPVSIAAVQTTASTVAHGLKGTTSTTFDREWCGITGPALSISGCISPDSALAQQVVSVVDNALQKAQIYVEPVQRQATPGGYQAVVTKDPATQAADATVNDDNTTQISGMQLVVYDDGSEGFNRLVLELADVHAESRYGIEPTPVFGSGTFSDGSDNGSSGALGQLQNELDSGGQATPGDTITYSLASQQGQGPPQSTVAKILNGLGNIIHNLANLVGHGWEFLVQHPGTFALLFSAWTVFAAPVYLALRRRYLLRQLGLIGAPA